ncbi:hypothetical protein D3C76_1844650 [compost metagenome]
MGEPSRESLDFLGVFGDPVCRFGWIADIPGKGMGALYNRPGAECDCYPFIGHRHGTTECGHQHVPLLWNVAILSDL